MLTPSDRYAAPLAREFLYYMKPAKHPQEKDRLGYLERTAILDTSREQVYDDFVTLAAAICQVPMAALSLVDGERQWYKASVGMPMQETSRDISFCGHCILNDEPMIVKDSHLDPRFVNNELVLGSTNVRFYAGIPVAVEGHPLGALCVLDQVPRELSPMQISALIALGRQLSICLEARLAEQRQKEIAERLRHTETTLESTCRRFEELFQSIAVACYTTDTAGIIHEFNRQAESLFGVPFHEVRGKFESELFFAPEDRDQVDRLRNEILSGKSIRGKDRRVLKAGGEEVWTLYSSQPVIGPDNQVDGSINVYHDIADRKQVESELAQMNAALKSLASTDCLTQIYNRRWITEFLHQEFKAAQHNDLSVILLDVDHFKSYNDSFGHPAGDEVLFAIAKLIESQCVGNERVARYGGEEFLIVLPRTSSDEAFKTAESIRAAIQNHKWMFRSVTASLGVATISEKMRGPNQLVSLADVRLYNAKAQGRNQVGTSDSPPELATA